MRRLPAPSPTLLILGLLALGLGACNPDPTPEGGEPIGRLGQVGYRDGVEDETQNAERGTIIISEVLWSGSVTDEGEWDASDIFIEIRNEGNRPTNLSDFYLVVDGASEQTWRIPSSDRKVEVGEHVFIAAKDTGCFPSPDYVIPSLALPLNAPFRITLLDIDERLIEPAGSTDVPPFAGGYDFVRSRSMERVELMFGGRGTDPHMWHFYTPVRVDVVNNDRISESCQRRTLASPGRANSPDYSGAYATGSFE